MISVFSVFNALCVYCVVMVLIIVLQRRTPLVNKYGASILLLIFAAASLRLILPIEIPFAFVVAWPWAFLGSVSRFFSAHPGVVKMMIAVWALGAVVVLGREVRLYCNTRKQCRDYVLVEDERVQKIARRFGANLRVLVSPDVTVAFVLNGFRPTIYFPANEISDQEIEMTLAHEAQHVRNHDAWIKLAFVCLLSAMWWFIPMHFFRRNFEDLLEMRCDTKLMGSMSRVDRSAYMLTLTNAGKKAVEYRDALAAGKSMAVQSKSSLKRRIDFMQAYEKEPPRMSPVAVAAIVVVFLASYLVIIQPGLSPTEEELQNDTRNFYTEQYDDPKTGDKASSTFIWIDSNGRCQLFINYEFSRYVTEAEVASEEYQNVYIFEEGYNQ